jgi:hypothetical protein
MALALSTRPGLTMYPSDAQRCWESHPRRGHMPPPQRRGVVTASRSFSRWIACATLCSWTRPSLLPRAPHMLARSGLAVPRVGLWCHRLPACTPQAAPPKQVLRQLGASHTSPAAHATAGHPRRPKGPSLAPWRLLAGKLRSLHARAPILSEGNSAANARCCTTGAIDSPVARLLLAEPWLSSPSAPQVRQARSSRPRRSRQL